MTQKNPPLFQAYKLGVSYSSNFSLSDITFELSSGHFLALIGPNGSGKTTLLRCLSRGFQNYSGSISILSRDIKTFSHKKLARMLAMTLQNSPRPAHMKVFSYILLGRFPWLGLLGFFSQKDYACARECGNLCQVEHLFERELESLSGGEWQKVILARALCQILLAPQSILLLDEISSAMDPAKSIETFQFLSELSTRNTTIIAAIHDCNLAALFATHILALKKGKIHFYGKTRDVFTEENLSSLYDLPLGIFRHPQLGLPQIYPLVHSGIGTANNNIDADAMF